MESICIDCYSDWAHRAQVIRLWQEVFGYEAVHNKPERVIDAKIAFDDGLFFVATAGEAVIGTVMAGYDGHRGWIYSVAVAPAHRRNGVGSQLVRHAESALAQRGCMKVNLQIVEGNESVIAFYGALGFAVEKRISMGKRIPENIPGD